jgi:DNA modification methylase
MIELHLGDCLPFMQSLKDKSIDCVLTDPPYGIGKEYWDNEFETEFIRIEIDPGYFEIARKRIEQAAKQELLFVI